MDKSLLISRLGLIAGNGPLPSLALAEARRQGLPVTVAAIREEADPALEELTAQQGSAATLHWIGVGQLGRLLKVFKTERVDKALMVGQVRHVRIFAPGSRSPLSHLKHLPDLRMLRLLSSLPKKNTESLISGVIGVLEQEGLVMISSATFLQSLLADSGLMTDRRPTQEEKQDFDYAYPVAREVARLDLGQTIVVKSQAVVAVEAMEGTDETIRRASRLVQGERLTVVKVSRPHQDMRFDIPVIGPTTLSVMQECHVTALGIDAGRTLIIDRPKLLKQASELGISILGLEP